MGDGKQVLFPPSMWIAILYFRKISIIFTPLHFTKKKRNVNLEIGKIFTWHTKFSGPSNMISQENLDFFL
jgi:hypothetical protein